LQYYISSGLKHCHKAAEQQSIFDPLWNEVQNKLVFDPTPNPALRCTIVLSNTLSHSSGKTFLSKELNAIFRHKKETDTRSSFKQFKTGFQLLPSDILFFLNIVHEEDFADAEFSTLATTKDKHGERLRSLLNHTELTVPSASQVALAASGGRHAEVRLILLGTSYLYGSAQALEQLYGTTPALGETDIGAIGQAMYSLTIGRKTAMLEILLRCESELKRMHCMKHQRMSDNASNGVELWSIQGQDENTTSLTTLYFSAKASLLAKDFDELLKLNPPNERSKFIFRFEKPAMCLQNPFEKHCTLELLSIVRLGDKTGRSASATRVLAEWFVRGPGLISDQQTFGADNALHYATRRGFIQIARLLVLEFGFDVNMPGLAGSTALHMAARKRSPELAMLLVDELKADVEAKTKGGSTPLEIARRKGNEEVAAYLESKARERNSEANTAASTHSVPAGVITEVTDEDLEQSEDHNEGDSGVLRCKRPSCVVRLVDTGRQRGKFG
jgi:hypothetical protein